MKITIERNHWKTRILLTQGKFARVSRKDYDFLNQWKWHYSHGYAVRRIHRRLGKDRYTGTYLYMHRLLMECPDGMVVDHINGDGLDNRRGNLRVCSQQKNLWNRRVQSNNKLGVKGVRWNKHKNRYEPQIIVNGKKVYLGRYKTVEEASRAYREAAIKYFGEFAYADIERR